MFSLSIGVARTARLELGVSLASVEVDSITNSTASQCIGIYEEVWAGETDRETSPEQEYAIVDDVVYIGRILPLPAHTGLAIADQKCMAMDKSKMSRSQQFVPACSSESLIFPHDAAYLLVGGRGGLGQGLARWMVALGARHLVLCSRNAGRSKHDQQLLQELQSQGCTVTTVMGDISVKNDAQRAVKSATAPLKGIINLAMVLSDAPILSITAAEWTTAVQPKVAGTWNLHEATLDLDLDFFVLSGSMSGIFGMPGQANYAAGNTFLDAFVTYRHHCKLPASVIDLGPVEGIGHVAENAHILERSKWLDYFRMTQREFFEAIAMAIVNGGSDQERGQNYAQLITGLKDTNDQSSSAFFLDKRWSAYFDTSEIRAEVTLKVVDPLYELARTLKSGGSIQSIVLHSSVEDFLAVQITKWVFDLLMKPVEDESEIDISRSLNDVGFDSLAAVEMRSWLRRSVEADISVLEIMSSSSFRELGQRVLAAMEKKHTHKQ